MQAACESGEVWAVLEGSAEEAAALFASVREPWLVRSMLLYHARTGSAHVLRALARAPEPHARHLLDALGEQLARPEARRAALAALAPLVALRPAWLPRAVKPALARELAAAARAEAEPAALLHALLALAVLLAGAPALAGGGLVRELAAALLRGGAGDAGAAAALAVARAEVFRVVYATQPVALAEALRAELAAAPALARALRPLAAGVRLHPALLAARAQDAARLARLDLHDVLAECHRLSLPAPPYRKSEGGSCIWSSDPPAVIPPGAAAGAGDLVPGGEGWWTPGERAGSPPPDPEPAVEATPDNTPAEDSRQTFRFPDKSSAVRAIGRRDASPGSGPGPVVPLPDACSSRLARLAAERKAAAPPDAPPVERPKLTHQQEVCTNSVEQFEAVEQPAPTVRVARPRGRARSAGRAPGACHVAVQTVDTLSPTRLLQALCGDHHQQQEEKEWTEPSEQLSEYLTSVYLGRGGEDGARAALALTHAQLQYERWRREGHAERARRLLGRVRTARAAELGNDALRERLALATAERDRLRAALAARAPAPPPADALAAQLQAERAARLRAEAAARDAAAARAVDAAELQRTRGEAFDAARHVEALARAALAAERRAEHVRRLRRELLVLGERCGRLERAARAGAGESARGARAEAGERALRAAAARAERDAEAATARAEALSARVGALEAALAARDATAAELRRAARAQADEHEARQAALADKYAALLRVLRASEAGALRRAAAAPPAPRRPPPPAAPEPGPPAPPTPSADSSQL